MGRHSDAVAALEILICLHPFAIFGHADECVGNVAINTYNRRDLQLEVRRILRKQALLYRLKIGLCLFLRALANGLVVLYREWEDVHQVEGARSRGRQGGGELSCGQQGGLSKRQAIQGHLNAHWTNAARMQVRGHTRALAENQDRQWTAAGDFLRDAAHVPAPGACAVMTTHNNEVCLMCMRGGKDRQRRIARQYLCSDAYAGEHFARGDHSEILLRALDFRIDGPYRYAGGFQVCDIRVDNMQ